MQSDCSKCENCIRNYIDINISQDQNLMLRCCLKRICLTSNSNIKMEVGFASNPVGLNEKSNNETSKSKLNVEDVKDSLSTLELADLQSGTSKELEKWGHEPSGAVSHYDKEEVNIEDSSDESDEANNNEPFFEKCGSCSGCCAPDCGSCWPCLERDVQFSSKTPCTAKICSRFLRKTKQMDSNGEKNIQVERKESKNPTARIGPRKRCGICPGCKTIENCGACNACIRKQKDRLSGKEKIYQNVCNMRRCQALMSERSQRCGQCQSCQSLPCEECGHCKAGNKKLCWAKRCKNPTWVKIKKRIPKNMKMKDEVNKPMCSGDGIFEHFKSKGVSGKDEKENKVSEDNGVPKKDKLKLSNHIKRTKKCGKCKSCEAKDCGRCENCKMNEQFGEKIILGKLPCLTNICEFPEELQGGKSINIKSMLREQDDAAEGSVCPVKQINGRLYDGRCFYCRKLPRAGKSSRSELLRHYATNHFSKQLKDEFGAVTFCRQCNIQLKVDAANHFGQKHEAVVKYLPREAANLLLEKKHQRSIVRTKGKKLVWPELPEGFDPASDTRDWKDDSHDEFIEKGKAGCEIMDGWTIEHEVEELEEPLLTSKEPDFTGVGGICNVCQVEYLEVTKAAMHLHQDHGIQGGSSYIMRDCDKLIKSGFIKLVSQDNVKTGINDTSEAKCTSQVRSFAKKSSSRRPKMSSTTSFKLESVRDNSDSKLEVQEPEPFDDSKSCFSHTGESSPY